MTEDRRQRIDELFLELCDLAPEQWEIRLEEACKDDGTLRSEVLSLLREDRSTGGFLPTSEAGPQVRLAELLKRMPLEKPPKEIGGYRILGVLGRGSMGVVYEAEQARPHRRVALKVRATGLDSERERRRFEREAEILGRLHHPGIAQIHEWGLVESENGAQPYLVLELIDGKPLVRWADEHRLGLVARLELFMRVCAAVQHAHQQGVIHRDLKPSNILVTDPGQPKVLDFGIARSLNADTVQTLEGAAVIGTLAYMSPEQAEGKTNELDTRTDIHALGVILHELLTGRLPYEVKGKPIHVALRILIGEEPRKLHEHVPSLRGDLDHIVSKALEKDPDRRYSSAQTLAEDISRYLRREPILARSGTTVYQIRKWVARNRVLASGIAATFGALVAGLVVALLLKTQSDQNALWAEENAGRAKESEARALAGESVARSEKDRADSEAEEARRKTAEVLRLSALQKLDDLVAEADRLWPAYPDNVAKYEDWLKRAQALVDELPQHEKTLADLRATALPWTDEMQAQHRESHPRLKELESVQRHLAYLYGLTSGEPPEEASTEALGIDWSALPKDANGLNDLAWPLVDPKRKDGGGEAKGLVLARKAVELAASLSGGDRAGIRDTLAWALFANARFDDAVEEEEQALDEAGTERKKDFEGKVEELKKAIDERISPEGLEAEAKLVSELESQASKLEVEVSQRPEWLFADDEDKWWHNQLEKLVNGIHAFADEQTGLFSSGTSEEHGWGMKKRLEFASSIAERTVKGTDAAQQWSAAIGSLASKTECPQYDGLRISPQLGLLPIERDPKSGLWEFAHLQTGEPAERGPDGKLVLKEETGLVFVLLPGATFTMGAQSKNPAGPNYDPQAGSDEGPPHEVTLSPFFLSKYEMTQGQWLRFAGKNPSYYPAGRSTSKTKISLLHPVEQVSWIECQKELERLGLVLPSEAQWEYGCRSGSRTAWQPGDSIESLRGFANIADEGSVDANQRVGWLEPGFSDGWDVHCPIGSLQPNSFGLHEMHGNVWEWCRDGYYSAFYRRSPKQDPVADPAGSSTRVDRGGGFLTPAAYARSAIRANDAPVLADGICGLRPAVGIAP